LTPGPSSDGLAERRRGFLFGLGAYGCWGLLPLYLKALAAASAVEILCHRVLWAQAFLLAIVWWSGRLAELRAAFRPSRRLAALGLTSLLIATNWLVYIWAVVSGRLLEASLGYYINPLVNVLLGVLVLKERPDRPALVAVALAGVGVGWLALRSGSPPWLSLVLALTFGFYGLLRKQIPVGSLIGLIVETTLLLPLVAGYLARQWWVGRGSFMAGNPTLDALLVLAGPVTAIPLLLFAGAARRLPLWTLGLLQYVSPSIQFLLAVELFGEQLSPDRLLAFGFIWTALLVFATTRR
jgi:chloramphenicol-sensitive protein RarD